MNDQDQKQEHEKVNIPATKTGAPKSLSFAYALFVALALFVSGGSPTAVAETLTNNDVVKLVKAGLASDTINLSIRSAADTNFDTSANGLSALATAGVPDSVVQTMISRQSGASSAASAPAAVAVRPLKSVRREVLPAMIEPTVGQQYFTRFNFWYERGRHSTTNYSRGKMLPINSKVTLTSIGAKKMVLTLESGDSVTLALAQKFSLRSLNEIASELLADQQIPIDRLGDDLSKAISQGSLRLGMTREQVLMTRGYPPRHKTPSLDIERWVYWSSRFVHRTLVFQDDVLVRGRGIN